MPRPGRCSPTSTIRDGAPGGSGSARAVTEHAGGMSVPAAMVGVVAGHARLNPERADITRG